MSNTEEALFAWCSQFWTSTLSAGSGSAEPERINYVENDGGNIQSTRMLRMGIMLVDQAWQFTVEDAVHRIHAQHRLTATWPNRFQNLYQGLGRSRGCFALSVVVAQRHATTSTWTPRHTGAPAVPLTTPLTSPHHTSPLLLDLLLPGSFFVSVQSQVH